MPETGMIFIRNRLIFESCSESRRSDLGGGGAALWLTSDIKQPSVIAG